MENSKGKIGGIRLRVTVMTLAVSVVAMAVIVGLSAYAAWSSVEQVIARSLVERLDAAEKAVFAGDFERAIDQSGNDILQIIGADGKVIVASPNAKGLSALSGDDDSEELDDVEIELDDDDDEGEGGAAGTAAAGAGGGTSDGTGASGASSASGQTAQPSQPAEASPAPVHDDWDDHDDDSDYDDYGGGEPAHAIVQQDYDDYDDDYGDDRDDGDDDYDDEVGTLERPIIPQGRGGGSGGPLEFLADLIGPKTAFAAEGSTASDGSAAATDAGPSVLASDVLGTPGPFLIMRRPAESPSGPVTLAAMTSLAPAAETAWGTAWVMAGILAGILVLVGLFTWFMTGRTLRPVHRMRLEAEAISFDDLHKRITAPESDRDLKDLAITFNGLLARIEASVDEQKRFVSDASHELKSPIAAMGLMIEALRAHPERLDDGQVLTDLDTENARLAHIVDDLLTLARRDEGRLAVHKAPADLCDILYEEAGSLRRRTGVEVDVSGVMPVVGLIDASLLSHALRNLLDNAARYAASAVYVSCVEEGGEAVIRISDDGPGIPEESRESVFGRFVRVESDRSRREGSTGLGLAVTRGIVEQLGGTVRFGEPEHGGATAIVTLPLE